MIVHQVEGKSNRNQIDTSQMTLNWSGWF